MSEDSLIISAPYRIDIAGGVSDIPFFNEKIGTAVCNFAIDVYDLDGNLQNIKIEFGRSEQWSFKLNGRNFKNIVTEKVSNLFKHSQYKNIKINSPLGQSAGLGGSSALVLILLTALEEPTKKSNKNLSFVNSSSNKRKSLGLIKKAYDFERNICGLIGGFQDFVPVTFGGMCFINSSIEKIASPSNKFGLALPENLNKFFDNRMFLILLKNKKLNSEAIVNNEIRRVSRNESLMSNIESIIDANCKIYKILISKNKSEANKSFSKIKNIIDASWLRQKELSSFLGNNLLEEICEYIKSKCYGVRGPGAGVNGLFGISKPDQLKKIINFIKDKHNKSVDIYRLKINHTGIKTIGDVLKPSS